VAAVLLTAAAPASAAPPPILGLDDLQTELAAQGPIDGFMKTSMSGTTVSSIPVRILAVVDGFYWGKLIMFECTDTSVTDIGGIAAGMSGSPLYVNVDGTDRMVGAVSYGDWFTLRGTGLATPIEYMTALQSRYDAAAEPAAAASVRLDEPVTTSTGVVRKLVLGSRSTAATAATGTSVMHPLCLARITGLPSGSAAYARLAARLEDSGLTVVAGDGAGAAGPAPALEAGSPCGVVFSTGLYGLSALGTVTYVDGDTALLFGHPILGGYSGLDLGMGRIEGTLTGANVDALWPSPNTPYKMMSPLDAKGTVVQDRSAGMLAHLTGSAATFPVSTRASLEGGAAVDDVTHLGHWFATEYYPEIADMWGDSYGMTTAVASAGLYHGLDSDPLAGSATTTTTIVASDGSDDYTFRRENTWDNNGDESWMGLADTAAGDVMTIMAAVLDDPYGVRDVRIQSVDVDADFSATRRYAGISDLSIARAIRAGDNDVTVTYYRYGSADPQTLHATLTVPRGTDLSGYVSVLPAARWNDYYDDYSMSSADAPETLAETQAQIDALPTNADVKVAFVPNSSEEDDYYYYEVKPAAEALVRGEWVFGGGLEKSTASVVMRTRARVDLGEPIRVSGYVRRASEDVPVTISCQAAGEPEPTEPIVTVTTEEIDGQAVFSAVLPGSLHNVLVTAEVAALTADTLPGAAQATVRVRARTRLTAAKRGARLVLTARVAPADADGDVVFQRYRRGRWVKAGSAEVRHGTARLTIAGRGVTRVRARFAGGDDNAASAWATARIK
jgi:hypothetical protein